MSDWRTKHDQELTAQDVAAMRKEALSQLRSEIVLRVTLLDNDQVEIWVRDVNGMSGQVLADTLRFIADGFEKNDVKRVR